MKTQIKFPKKEVKANLTIRIPPSLRLQAEEVAKKNQVSLAVVVETGIRLIVDNQKELASK